MSKMDRRSFLGLAGSAAGIMVIGACSGGAERQPIVATDPAVAEREARRAASGRVVQRTLAAAPLELDLAGRVVTTWGFDGTVPGLAAGGHPHRQPSAMSDPDADWDAEEQPTGDAEPAFPDLDDVAVVASEAIPVGHHVIEAGAHDVRGHGPQTDRSGVFAGADPLLLEAPPSEPDRGDHPRAIISP